MAKVVYHASKVQGLKLIEPRVSSHGQAWVYAAPDLATAAMFLGKHHNFILGSGHVDDLPYIVERFPGAFEQAKGGVAGSIYVLPADTFMLGQTTWAGDWVSASAVQPIDEIQVVNANAFLLDLAQNERLVIKFYPERFEHIPDDDSDLIEMALELQAQHGQRFLDWFARELGGALPHVFAAIRKATEPT